jgi:hypothetical protein
MFSYTMTMQVTVPINLLRVAWCQGADRGRGEGGVAGGLHKILNIRLI